mgnify:CR=1 FL=1
MFTVASHDLVALVCFSLINASHADRVDSGGKMNQKFSTFLDQSFDTYRILDRHDKSGDRA